MTFPESPKKEFRTNAHKQAAAVDPWFSFLESELHKRRILFDIENTKSLGVVCTVGASSITDVANTD